VLELLKEPFVNLCEFVYLVDGVSLMHCLRDYEDTLVGGFAQGDIDIINLQLFVLHKTVHALSYHAQAFLNGFLKSASYRHNLTDRLH